VSAEDSAPPAVDDGNPVLRDYSADSDVLIVSFGGLRRRPEILPGFSFVRVLDGLPARKLLVRDLQRAWFLRGLPGISRNVPETAAFLNREIETARARRVVMIGFSLGGFAAMLYGHLLQVAEVHAFSPQTFVSLGRRLRHRDSRWQRFVFKFHLSSAAFAPRDLQPLLARATGRTRQLVYYATDSRLDTVHAEHVRGLPGVELCSHPEGGHRLVTDMRDRGELRTIIERAIQGTPAAAPAAGSSARAPLASQA
jgi:pimeloyl-ACP methyl ester carboxylesterase